MKTAAAASRRVHPVLLCAVVGFLLLAAGAGAGAEIIFPGAIMRRTPRPGIAVPDAPGADTDPSAVNPKAAKVGGPDVLQFINRDTLHGTLLAIDGQNTLRWQNTETGAPILFTLASLSEIRLVSSAAPRPANAPPDRFSVRLTNDDELTAAGLSLEGDTVSLDTWYAGKLNLPRRMVRGIMPLQTSDGTLYEGPTSAEGWKISQNGRNGAWRYRNGAFYASTSGSLARDVKLPDRAAIDFDLSWRGGFQMMFSFYTDSLEGGGSNGYALEMNNSYVYLQRLSRNGSSNLGQAQINELNTKNHAHFSLRVNKEQKLVALLVDGALVKQWTERGEFAGKGTGILFYAQSSTPIRLNRIKVGAWDGKFEDAAASAAGADKSKEDTVRLQNKDKVSGHLTSIKDGQAKLDSTYATLTVPLERIEGIDFAGEGANQAKRQAGEIRAFFAGRGRVTMVLEKWDGKEAVGSSPNFGKATFLPAAFERLQFNLSEKPVGAGDDFEAAPAGGKNDEEEGVDS